MLESQYSTTDMCAVLSASLKKTGEREATYLCGLKHPYFYEGVNSIIFPPVSDTENIGLDSIDEMLRITMDYCRINSINIDNKTMVFPVAEAQKILFMPRMHWITLHYDPHAKTATLIDSRPWWAGWLYSIEPMKQSLITGLARLNLAVETFEIKYQSVQYDNIHCGAWTAANIQAFARGASITDQMTVWVVNDSNNIVQNNIDLVHAAQRMRLGETNQSSETLHSSDHEEDYFSCSSEDTNPEKIEPGIEPGVEDIVEDRNEENIEQPVTADFQLQCIQALLIGGSVLFAMAVLTCPLVAGAIFAASVSFTASGLAAASLLTSAGIFAVRLANNINTENTLGNTVKI